MNSQAGQLRVEPPPVSRGYSFFTFGVIWCGNLISAIGSRLSAFVLGIWIYQKTGSTTQFALVPFLAALPAIAIAPVVGSLVDRYNLRNLMLWSNAGAAAVELAVTVLFYLNRLQIWHIYVAVLFVPAFALMLEISYAAAIPNLVRKEQLGRSAGMMQAAQAIAQILPPVMAGVLLARIHYIGILVIDLCTYFIFIALLFTVVIPQVAPKQTAQSQEWWRSLTAGWTFIHERRGLLGLLIYFAAVNLCLGTAVVLVTPLILSFSNAKALGGVFSIAGLGYLAGSVLMSLWGGPKGRVAGILQLGTLFGLCLMLMGVRPSFFGISAAAFGAFFFVPLINGCETVIWQRKTPEAIRGRVFSAVRMVARSTVPVGYILAGPLVDKVFGPMLANEHAARTLRWLIGQGVKREIGLVFVLAGVLLMLTQISGYLFKRVRSLEQELPDAIPEPSASP